MVISSPSFSGQIVLLGQRRQQLIWAFFQKQSYKNEAHQKEIDMNYLDTNSSYI